MHFLLVIIITTYLSNNNNVCFYVLAVHVHACTCTSLSNNNVFFYVLALRVCVCAPILLFVIIIMYSFMCCIA